MSVELARLSIWIHTFVPGLPLSFLSRNLVQGNSLVGVATIQETISALGGGAAEGETLPLLAASLRQMLDLGHAELERLGRISDVDRAEIEAAREAAAGARKKLAPLEAIFDVVTAARLDEGLAAEFAELEKMTPQKALSLLASPKLRNRAKEVLATIVPFHFPIAFPEVFLAPSPGFDVILGNPPWEEVTVEHDRFWGRHIPGVQRGLSGAQRSAAIRKISKQRPDLLRELERETAESGALRKILLSGDYPGMGTGDPDLYKAFVWRFWHLAAAEGRPDRRGDPTSGPCIEGRERISLATSSRRGDRRSHFSTEQRAVGLRRRAPAGDHRPHFASPNK
jgi:hypothetical protein